MASEFGYEKPSDFRPGERVALHPALDLWMRGVRFGTVMKIGRKKVLVNTDNAGRKRISPENLGKVV